MTSFEAILDRLAKTIHICHASHKNPRLTLKFVLTLTYVEIPFPYKIRSCFLMSFSSEK